MKKRLRVRCSIVFIITLLLVQLLSINSMAATTGSFSVSISSKEMDIGDSASFTISTTNCAGQFSIKSSDSNIVSVSSGSEWVEGTKQITITAKSAGNATITITAENVGDNQEEPEDVTGSKTIAVTVKAKTPPTPTPEPKPEPKPDPEPEKPTVEEPKFTDANETVYAKSTVNIRQGYSTSDKIVGSLQKGESITRIGIGSNGWSKVKYNGTTAYISSTYLTTTKPEEEKKSDNANLKSLTLENQELTPVFSKDVTSYAIEVKNDITELNVNAEAEDVKATVSVQGNKDLKDGENTVTVSVSAEDGTIKIYEIKVTKLAKTALGLKTLTIKDTDISEFFKSDIYEYKIDIEDVEKLEIEAIANDETATVEILGNEDLQDGENLITIMVSSKDGEETVTYQIKANKGIAKTAPIVEEKQEMNPKIYLFIGIGAVLLIALIIVIVYTIKHRNNEEEYDYSDNYEGFPEELPERQEQLEEDNQNLEQTQEMNYNEEVETDITEEQDMEERKAKIDYFLDAEDNEEKPRRRRGKHF